MPKCIAILEDDLRRIDEMRRHLDVSASELEYHFFEDANEMIAWLREHLADTIVMSLDHDLPLRFEDGRPIDFGTGRQVADFLIGVPPSCPVIVHSSNMTAAAGMVFALQQAWWPVTQVYPCEDLAWIAATWMPELLRRCSRSQ